MVNLIRNLFCSSLGKKYLMAGSGAVMFLFVVGHLVGNLQIFLGAEAINRYGHFLQSNVELLWPVRIALLAIIALHIWSATRLTLENRAARPQAYEQWQPTAATYASRTMMMSGIIVAIFIIYHLLHYKRPPQTIPRVPENSPHKDWIRACKGGLAACSNFDISGPFTEWVLLGNLAMRLGKKLHWDSEHMHVTNAPEAEALIRGSYREGWEV